MNAWKCYRCNLSFTEESHVDMHHQLTKHSARPIEFVQG